MPVSVALLCRRDEQRSPRDWSSVQNGLKAPQLLVLLRADRGLRRHRIGTAAESAKQVMRIARYVARPLVGKNYVKVWLTAFGPGAPNSSITGPKRSSTAHSCDLRIGSGSSLLTAVYELAESARSSPLPATALGPRKTAQQSPARRSEVGDVFERARQDASPIQLGFARVSKAGEPDTASPLSARIPANAPRLRRARSIEIKNLPDRCGLVAGGTLVAVC